MASDKNSTNMGYKYLQELSLPPLPSPVKHLDSTDALLLSEIQRGVTQIRDLRKSLHRRTAIIIGRMNKFREQNVIARYYEMRHIGLGDDVLVLSRARENQDLLASLILRLPYTYVESDYEKQFLFWLKLPKSGPIKHAESLDEIDDNLQIHFFSIPFYGGWQLADFISDWNFYHGTWNPHSTVDH